MLRAGCGTPGTAETAWRADMAPTLQMPPPRDATIERRKDWERRAMVDVALSLAELDASWGDYAYAIEYLDAANELTRGALTQRWAAKRRRWVYAARGYYS
jgi:hypothetical protein